MAADEIFVLVLVAVCAGVLIAMAVNSDDRNLMMLGHHQQNRSQNRRSRTPRPRPNHAASGESAEPKGGCAHEDRSAAHFGLLL